MRDWFFFLPFLLEKLSSPSSTFWRVCFDWLRSCLCVFHFSALSGRRHGWGCPLSFPLPITGLQSHGPSCPLLQPGDLRTPSSETPADSSTAQGTALLSLTRWGHLGLMQEPNRTGKYMCLGLRTAKGAREMGRITVSRTSLQGFLNSSVLTVEGVPQLAWHEQLKKQGSLVGTQGSVGSISYWLYCYSVDNVALLLTPEVSQGL